MIENRRRKNRYMCFNEVLSSTDLADVSAGEAHQCGEPVSDVQ